jgi:hypothetical protein
MSLLEEMAATDPLFAAEIRALSEEERRWLEDELVLRRRAAALALELGHDASDVLHQLKHFRRSPRERLRLGLSHGRLRARSAH